MSDSNYIRYGKRIFDLVFGLLGFILLLPLILFISLWIMTTQGPPVFFLQERVGKNFQKFNLIKFRTMIKNADGDGPQVTADDDLRITKAGRTLRRFKLDELPQFINVLKGEMSLVGPRPEVEQYVIRFKEAYEQILRIRPGITDFAAIEFRDEQRILQRYEDKTAAYLNELLPRKIELYQKYIGHISLTTDLRIILKTLRSIL